MLDRSANNCDQAIYPSDLNILKGVFDALCHERGYFPESEDALDIAAELVRHFQTGTTDESVLKVVVRPKRQAFARRQFSRRHCRLLDGWMPLRDELWPARFCR